MEYKNYDVDEIEKLPREKIEEILEEINREAKRYYNYEQAIKLMLNSIYGAFGNEWFYFFDVNIAETITLQGQDAILYAEQMINTYFFDFWHKDTKLHEELGITVRGKIIKPATVYIDTDSCYISFEEAMKSCNWQGTEKEFIMKIYNIRLKKYIDHVLQKYAERWHGENFLSFELESIAKNAIWLAKKKYMQNIVWTDPDIHYEELTRIKSKGFEIIQSSTPLFARTKLKELLTYIFAVDQVEISELVKKLKLIKKEFKLTNIEHLTFNIRINNYDKYILSDGKDKEFTINSGCPQHLRGAGYHNFLLNNSKFKNKYQLLTNSEKIKVYHSLDKSCNVFAFKSGDFPYEIAPELDYDTQFEKSIIDPINRVLEAIGLQTLDRNLIYSASLF